MNCMNCRFSPVRKKWFEKYEVPEDIEEKCARGKTIEEIKAEHVEIKKKRKEKDDGLGNAYEILKCTHIDCGCSLYSKLWKNVEECPLKKWTRIKEKKESEK